MTNTIEAVILGTAGPPGPPPITTLTGAFTMPAVSASATATVGTTAWMVVGGYVQMAGAGVLQIVSIPSLGAVVLANTGASGNAAQGTVIEAGAGVGVIGPPGATVFAVTTTADYVQPAPSGTATVAVSSIVPFFVNAPVNVAGNGVFYGTYLVTSISGDDVTIQWLASGGGVSEGTVVPSGAAVFPSTLPGGSILGQQVVGTSTVANGAADWAGVNAGATLAIFSLPTTLGLEEIVSLSCSVNVGSNLTPATVAGCTGNGVDVVLTLSSTVGLASGDRVFISGVGGNAAANGGAFYSVSGSTIALFQDAALSVPIVGTGTWTGGGQVQSLGFGNFQRSITVRETHGLVLNSQMGSADQDLTMPPEPANVSPSMAGCAVAIVPAGNNTLNVNVTAPSNVPVLASIVVSYMRSPIPGAGPVPTVTSASVTSGPDVGGTQTVITGTGFTGTTQVSLAGIPASFVVNSSTQITATSGVDTGDEVSSGVIAVTTQNGTGSNPSVTWTYTPTPFGIFGPNVHFGVGAGIVQSGGNVTAWDDGNVSNPSNLTLTAGSGTATYNAIDASFNNQPSVSMTANAYFENASADVVSGQSLFMWIVFTATESTYSALMVYDVAEYPGEAMDLYLNPPSAGASKLSLAALGRGTDTINSPTIPTNTPTFVWASSDDGSAPSGGSSKMAIANGTPAVLTAVANSFRTGKVLAIGNDGNSFAGKIAHWGYVRNMPVGGPTSTQLANLHTYIQNNWGSGL